ncbi:hypothetical protein LTS18_011498 [Coniosporium uncinatum]|uniref:Uncharacterized protein n=1 Tax=Coniosporium uncinatum TaxID=93489 RepID=A0ACC3CYH0_9PEZI|nr:hypothetical protein LTS18_011498 [Coniosporium uncinatum]
MSPKMSGLPSVTSSPLLRPSSTTGGISALKAQLDSPLANQCLERPSTLRQMSGTQSDYSVASTTISETGSGSDSEKSSKTAMDTYEISIEHDFVSVDAEVNDVAQPLDSNIHLQSLSRKMTPSDFEPLKVLGKGSFGKVMLVRQKASGRLFAQKQLKKASIVVHKKMVERTRTERAILEQVNRHPFVVKLFYAFQDADKLYLILEYASGGELFHHLSAERLFPEPTVSFYMAELVLAISHLHRNLGVVYRDLKPENCLLDSEGHLLLTDFGLSKVAVDEDDRCKSFLGTVGYMAPEIIQEKEYGFAVDWWSLGVLGYDLLTGSCPWTGNNTKKIEENVVKKPLSVPYYVGPDAKDLFTRLLRKDPAKRLGSNMPKDLQTIKGHRFFKKWDWKKLEKREIEPPIRPFVGDPEDALNFDEEFTGMPLSPRPSEAEVCGSAKVMDDPFGGFSFVASSSFLESGQWGF